MARLLPSWVYSLLRLSLPEMNGVLYASARSWQACAASTSEPSVSGRSVLPQQKLSSRAIRRGWAPTATQLRIGLVDDAGRHGDRDRAARTAG